MVIDSSELSETSPFDEVSNYLGIEFKGIVSTTPELKIIIETISRGIPKTPVGISFGPCTIDANLDEWENGTLQHRLDVILIDSAFVNSHFNSGSIIPTFGTNFSSNGLVIQLIGSPDSLSSFLTDLRQRIPIKKITTSLSQPIKANDEFDDTTMKVISAAFDQGFYNSPKSTSLRTLAKDLQMSKSSVSNHLRIAESRLVQKHVQDR